ncbi:MAG TPA: sigma-70 family RNA polymerase sigma factor [Actinomycetota bacterium]|nr:sigma-70 family RNA polymerase sigma factor [Actinomycetota bacterium]
MAESSLETGESLRRLERLYVRHAGPAIRLAYLLCGDRHLAEDLVQDAFVRLAGRFADLRDADAFQAYLRRTVINQAKMHGRRRNLERRRLEELSTRPAPHATDTDSVADRATLRAALLALPYRQRAAIVLRYYADLSEAQAAEALGCGPAALRSLVARGMQTLREKVSR